MGCGVRAILASLHRSEAMNALHALHISQQQLRLIFPINKHQIIESLQDDPEEPPGQPGGPPGTASVHEPKPQSPRSEVDFQTM